MMHNAWCNVEEVPYIFSRSSIKFEGHTGWEIDYLNPIWMRAGHSYQIIRFALFSSINICEPWLTNQDAGLILGLRPANDRRRYKVTPSLIDWAQA